MGGAELPRRSRVSVSLPDHGVPGARFLCDASCAAPHPHGLNVVTVWQSRAHQERWGAEQLFPAFQALGLADVPANSEFTEYETGELYIR